MSARRTIPPFRAEHIGSLIRPPTLIQARQDWRDGRLAHEQLRALEDKCIRDVVKLQ